MQSVIRWSGGTVGARWEIKVAEKEWRKKNVIIVLPHFS